MELHPFPTDKQVMLPLTLPILGFGVGFFLLLFIMEYSNICKSREYKGTPVDPSRSFSVCQHMVSLAASVPQRLPDPRHYHFFDSWAF